MDIRPRRLTLKTNGGVKTPFYMEVNKAAWEKLRKQIEYHTQQDSEITDVHINYQVKETKNKNYLKLNITIDKWDKITE